MSFFDTNILGYSFISKSIRTSHYDRSHLWKCQKRLWVGHSLSGTGTVSHNPSVWSKSKSWAKGESEAKTHSASLEKSRAMWNMWNVKHAECSGLQCTAAGSFAEKRGWQRSVSNGWSCLWCRARAKVGLAHGGTGVKVGPGEIKTPLGWTRLASHWEIVSWHNLCHLLSYCHILKFQLRKIGVKLWLLERVSKSRNPRKGSICTQGWGLWGGGHPGDHWWLLGIG